MGIVPVSMYIIINNTCFNIKQTQNSVSFDAQPHPTRSGFCFNPIPLRPVPLSLSQSHEDTINPAHPSQNNLT